MKKVFTTLSLVFLISFQIIAQTTTEATSKVWGLQECIDYALENSLNVQRSENNVENSLIDRKQAKFSMIPSLNGNATVGYNWGRSINPVTNLFVTQEVNSNNLGLNSSVTIFNGLRIQNTIKQTTKDYFASEADLEKAKNDVIISVVTLYTTVIFNMELLETAKLQLNSSQEQYERTKKQVEVGALAKAEQLNMDATVATNELNLIQRENALALSLLQLKQALQLPGDTDMQVEVPEIGLDELVLDQSKTEIYETALLTMPEVKSADLRLASSEYALKAAKGNLYPRLSASGNISTNYSSVSDRERFEPDGGFVPATVDVGYVQGTNEPVVRDTQIPTGTDYPNYGRMDQFQDNVFRSLNVTLTIPVFNGWQATSTVQRSKVARSQSEIALQETKNQLRQAVETAYNDALAAEKTYSSVLRQVAAREEAFRMAQQRYNLNAINFVEYQVSENDYFQAKSDLLRAKYDFIFKMKVIDFYQGKPLGF